MDYGCAISGFAEGRVSFFNFNPTMVLVPELLQFPVLPRLVVQKIEEGEMW